MTTITALVATLRCDNGHTYEANVIGPAIERDGSYSGGGGSSFDYCDECDAGVETVSLDQKVVEVQDVWEVDCYALRGLDGKLLVSPSGQE